MLLIVRVLAKANERAGTGLTSCRARTEVSAAVGVRGGILGRGECSLGDDGEESEGLATVCASGWVG